MWAKDYRCCKKCGTTKIKHMAKGLCQKCYSAKYAKENSERVKQQKHDWYIKNGGKNLSKITREDRWFSGKREAVLKRDKYKCTVCGEKKLSKLVVHHKDENGRGSEVPNNSMENLVTLCRTCHAREHAKAKQWSMKYDKCQICGTTETPHNAKGLCIKCYKKATYNKTI